jgi:hypothetical protein
MMINNNYTLVFTNGVNRVYFISLGVLYVPSGSLGSSHLRANGLTRFTNGELHPRFSTAHNIGILYTLDKYL